ncbi:hypothetical protein E6C27_scaffold437G001100 [Cucumis melo var. makuwa]|uniref:DNA-directed RNA polymerase I subunit RPA1-like n=1 Tax=Cucumis melo var. makuwa TaxID=1194695 RepID=A0A5A7UIN7_CUCMM|nr:hypothetical protein E6C27_scaffold437G001100 [Cucumis melo var. makuwa]
MLVFAGRSPQPPSASRAACRPPTADVSPSLSLRFCHRRHPLRSHLVFPTPTEHRGKRRRRRKGEGIHEPLPPSTSGHGSKELTLKFSDLAAGLFGDSFPFLGGITEYSSKGFPTTGPRIEAENVVIHRGLHVHGLLIVDWDFMLMDLEVTVQYVVIIGLDVDHGVWTGKDNGLVWTEGTRLICASFGGTRLICASFGSTRLICASFGSTRLMCASFGSTRLICASFGSTRLICAFYGTTRLLCRVSSNRKLTVVRAQRGADRREAERTREGHMDASGFLIASAMYFVRIFDLWF